MKPCSRCKINKPLSEYHSRDKRGVKKSYCKDCSKVYRRKYYLDNRDTAIQYAMKSNKVKKEKLTKFVYEYLQTHPCIDCGEADPVVLEFDHRVPEDKKENVSQLIIEKCSLTKLQEEISKCDVRCSNCHKRKTAIQFNWWITRM